jgi:hypothetical protein
MKETKFYKKTGKNAKNWYLSNFYPSPIEYMGDIYPTAEHLYQSMKCLSDGDTNRILSCPTPRAAKDLGREIGLPLMVNERASAMRMTILAKYTQHYDLRAKLMATEGLIIEESIVDTIWGEGDSRNGLNLMGLLLMELREKLRTDPSLLGF